MTSNKQLELGKKLGQLRILHGYTLEFAAAQLGVSKGYLSKVENGHKPVTQALINKYAKMYANSAKFSELMGGHKVIQQQNEGERRNIDMEQKIVAQPSAQQLQVSLNPETTQVVYSDWQAVNTSDGGVVISFAQSATPLPIQQIVSRVGMSHAQAKQLYNALGENLKSYFKSNDMEF